MFLLQKSIEDKLKNLKQEKKNIKDRIGHITPEIQKVIYDGNCAFLFGIMLLLLYGLIAGS